MGASGLLLHWKLLLGTWSVSFNYLFIFPSGYFPLWDSKTPHRPTGKSVSWCLETSFLRFPSWGGSPSLPLLSLFIFYILSYLLLKTMGCLSGCLMSSASIQKLYCGICSAFKCSLDEFVGEKVVSPSYSSTILGPPSHHLFKNTVFSFSWLLLRFSLYHGFEQFGYNVFWCLLLSVSCV